MKIGSNIHAAGAAVNLYGAIFMTICHFTGPIETTIASLVVAPIVIAVLFALGIFGCLKAIIVAIEENSKQ